MNPFKIGDKVKGKKYFSFSVMNTTVSNNHYIVTYVQNAYIGFSECFTMHSEYSNGEVCTQKKYDLFYYSQFELVKSAEDIDFEKRKKEILDESI